MLAAVIISKCRQHWYVFHLHPLLLHGDILWNEGHCADPLKLVGTSYICPPSLKIYIVYYIHPILWRLISSVFPLRHFTHQYQGNLLCKSPFMKVRYFQINHTNHNAKTIKRGSQAIWGVREPKGDTIASFSLRANRGTWSLGGQCFLF